MAKESRHRPQPPRPGPVLRSLRARHGWTLAEVSRRTGLTVSTLSKLENDKMSLSYEKMMKIATGLGIDIGVLFAKPGDATTPRIEPAMPIAGGGADASPSGAVGRRSITRRGEGRVIDNSKFTQLYPAADLLQKQLVPIISEVKARSRAEYGALLRHPGEEYLLVLEGAIELHTEFYAPVRLEAGDSIYFDSSMAHGYVAAASGPCRMLSVCSTADWGPAAAERSDVERSADMVRPYLVRSA